MSTVSGRRVLSHLADINDVDASDAVQGDMVYRNDVGLWVPVGGTKIVGNVPTIQADGAVAWEVASGGAGLLTLLEEIEVTGSAQTNLDFNGVSGAHAELRIELSGRSTAAVSSVDFRIQFGNGTIDTGANYGKIDITGGSSGDSFIGVTNGMLADSHTATMPGTATIKILQYANTSLMKACQYQAVLGSNSASNHDNVGGGFWEDTSAIDEIRLSLSAGDWAVGTVARLYGIG